MSDKIREATKPNIDRLYTQLFSIREMLIEVIQTANEAANDANSFGGAIAGFIPNQLRSLLVPGLQQYIDNSQNPVSVDSLVRFLDSLPLAKVRAGRAEETPVAPDVGMQAAAGGAPMAPAPAGAMTGLVPNAAPAIQPTMAESAILKAQGQPLLDTMRERWEAEHPEPEVIDGALDFRAIKEGYKAKPSTPEVFSKYNENKVYEKIVEASERSPNTTKLEEKDMLWGSIKREPVESMEGWRDLVEERVLDETINERLGAGAVADAILSENTDQQPSTKAGLDRMKELVSPEPVAADAGDVAALLMSGRLTEQIETGTVERVREAVQEADSSMDLASIISDAREPV